MGGSLLINEILEQIPINMRNLFLETGTYKGKTSVTVSPYFEKVITMEIHKPLFDTSQELFKNFKNIYGYFGDSLLLLESLRSKWSCVFFRCSYKFL